MSEILFWWDAGFFTSPSSALSYSVTRSYATVNPGGSSVSANTGRFWHRDRLLCGMPDPVIQPFDFRQGGPGVFNIVHAGGSDFDGTPLIVQTAFDPVWIDVVRLESPPVLWRTHANVGDGGPNDLLNESSPNETATLRHTTWAFTVFDGLIVAISGVEEKQEDTSWAYTSTSLCYTNLQSASPPSTLYPPGSPPPPPPPLPTLNWTKHWVSSSVNVGHDRGATFAIQGFRVLRPPVSSVATVWFAFTDYHQQLPGEHAFHADFYLVKATRSLPHGAWTLQTVQRVLSYALSSAPSGPGMHAHPPYVEAYGESGLCVVCPVGDSPPNNRVMAIYRDDESYTDGEAGPDDGDTANGWTTRLVHAKAGATPPSYDANAGWQGNQFVGSGPHPDGGSIIGGDEMIVPLMRTVIPATNTDKFSFYKLWGQPAGGIVTNSGVRYVAAWNSFFTPTDGNSAGAAYVVPGFTWDDVGDSSTHTGIVSAASRIIFTPDGTNWAPCFVHRDASANDPVVIAGESMYMSFANALQPSAPPSPPEPASFPRNVVSLPFPTTLLRKPLCIGGPGSSGGRNRMLDSLSTPTPPASNTIDDVTGSLPTGVDAPPCMGNVWRCKIVDDHELGVFAVSDTGDVTAGNLKVRFYVYVMPWSNDEGDPNSNANSLWLQVSVGKYNFADPLRPVASSRDVIEINHCPAVGAWVPITIDTDSSTWTDDDGTPAAPTGSFQLGLRLSSGSTNHSGGTSPELNPCDFLIAFDSIVSAGGSDIDYPGLPLPVGTSTAYSAEALAVSGFTCTDTWTILLALEIPDDAWDAIVPDRPTTYVLCTLYQSSTKWVEISVELTADVPSDSPLWSDETAKGTLMMKIGTPSVLAAPQPLTRQGANDYGPDRASFHRGTPIFLAVTCKVNGDEGYLFTLYTSIGTTLWKGELGIDPVSPSDLPKPTSIKSGNHAGTSPEAAYWWGGLVNTAEAFSESTIADHFRNLDFMSFPKV